MSFDPNVSVNIGLDAPALTPVGFGTGLIAGDPDPGFTERLRFYNTNADVQADPDLTTALKAAGAAAFAQNPKPARIAIGRVDGMTAEVWNVSIDTAVTAVYDLNIDGVLAATFSAGGGDTPTTICAGLVADFATKPFAGVIGIVDNGTDFDLTHLTTGVPFIPVQTPDPETTETQTVAAVTMDAELAAVEAENDDWFGVNLESRNGQHIQDAAAFVEASERLGVFQSSEADIITTASTDIASTLQNSSYRRTGVLYYSDDAEHAGFAWLANRLSVDPDVRTTTWIYVTLAGIPIETLTATERANLEGKNANAYLSFYGRGSTGQGTAADGTFLDLIVTISWLAARLRERFATLLSNLSNLGSKLPLNDDGLAVLEAESFAQLQIGEQTTPPHFIGGSSVVDMPNFDELPDADKSARIVRWSLGAEPAGAVHKVAVSGFITLNLELTI